MKTKSFEEVRKALLVAKESIEENLESLNSITEEEEEEEKTVNLRIEPEREREITIPQSKLCLLQLGNICMDESDGRWGIATRTQGPLTDKAFILDEEYDWQLGKDDEGVLCLVPIKKDKLK